MNPLEMPVERSPWNSEQQEVINRAETAVAEYERSTSIDDKEARAHAKKFVSHAIESAKKWNEGKSALWDATKYPENERLNVERQNKRIQEEYDHRRYGSMVLCFTDISRGVPETLARELVEKLFSRKPPEGYK
jgi:DNA repair photolyase